MRRAGIAGGDRWRRGRAGFKIRYPTIALVSLLKTSSDPGPSCWAVWHTAWCRTSSACLVYQSCNSDNQIHGAGVSIPAGGSHGRSLTIDRIRDPPTARELKRVTWTFPRKLPFGPKSANLRQKLD